MGSGTGLEPDLFAEKRNPTTADLDAISTEHPIVFTRVCEHMVVANSMALSMAGITKETENPEGGEIEHDENGNLTGLLKETARYLIYRMIPDKSVEEIKEMLVNAISIASSLGLTTMHSDDFETFSDITEVQEAARYIKEKCPEAFVMVSFAVNRTGYTAGGISMNRLFTEAAKTPEIDSYGCNCMIGAAHMYDLLKAQNLSDEKFIQVLPNSGYQEIVRGHSAYSEGASYYAEKNAEDRRTWGKYPWWMLWNHTDIYP